jgi:hypothetical protein
MATQTRRGRPRKDNKRTPLSMRIAPSLRERLESAVAENGRSITQEAELRLAQTFLKQDLLDQVLDLAFGHVNADLLHVIGVITKQANLAARSFGDNEHWRDDKFEFKASKDLIDELFAELSPGDAANERRTRNAKHMIRGAVLRELAGHNWLSRRHSDARATLFENWLKTQQVRFDAEAAEPFDFAALTSRIRAIRVLDDGDQPEGEQK